MTSRDDPGHEIDPAKGWRGLRSTYQERGPSRPGPTTAQSAQLNTPRRERRGYGRAATPTLAADFRFFVKGNDGPVNPSYSSIFMQNSEATDVNTEATSRRNANL